MIYISEGPHSLFLYNPTQFPASLELRYNPFEIVHPTSLSCNPKCQCCKPRRPISMRCWESNSSNRFPS